MSNIKTIKQNEKPNGITELENMKIGSWSKRVRNRNLLAKAGGEHREKIAHFSQCKFLITFKMPRY